MKKKSGPLAGILVLLIACLLCGLNRIFASEPEAETVSSTAASQPSDTAPAPTATQPSQAVMSIIPVDVTGNLEAKGFTCSEVQQGQSYYIRDCKKDGMTVSVYGRDLFSVDFIEAVTFDGNAADFLGFIATIPFVDDSDLQTQARAWVESNVTNPEATTVINEITFSILSNAQVVTLEIGELK